MADSQEDSTLNNLPVAQRRKRRSSSTASLTTNTHVTRSVSNTSMPPPSNSRSGMNTPPATPQRTKKRVRFSDPGPSPSPSRSSPSTGLTPFVRRASLGSSPSGSGRHASPPPSRRVSTPSSSRRWNFAVNDSPISGTLQFAPLRQVLEGRVKRRIRRNRLSEELCLIESEMVVERKRRKSEIERLREELQQKDLEIQHLQDETDLASQLDEESGVQPSGIDTEANMRRVAELEKQIADLKAELQDKQQDEEGQGHDWTLAARDPFNPNVDDDEDTFMHGPSSPNFAFDMSAGIEDSNVFVSTPARGTGRNGRESLQRSFPSPPSTTPNTPCKLHSGMDATTQAEDGEKKMMQTQLVRLKEELKGLYERLTAKLSAHSPLSPSFPGYETLHSSPLDLSDITTLDAALDAVLTALAVAQSSALDSSTRFSALSTELSTLSSDPSSPTSPDEIIISLKDSFRTARLELERLLPGETESGFSTPTVILSALLDRLRALVDRVAQQDADIDAYHEQEVSLRQQLGSRIDVNTSLQSNLNRTLGKVDDLETELIERDTSITKLTRALDTYRTEVTSLERLITSLETTHSAALSALQDETTTVLENQKQESTSALLTAALESDTLRAESDGAKAILAELEARLVAATASSTELEKQLQSATKEKATALRNLKKVNATHGSALALRDARVSELRDEVERVNTSLREAHAQILALRNQKMRLSREMEGLEALNAGLEGEKAALEGAEVALRAQVVAEKQRGKLVIDAMQAQLARALETGTGYLNGAVGTRSGLTPRKARAVEVGEAGSSMAGALALPSVDPETVQAAAPGVDEDENGAEAETGSSGAQGGVVVRKGGLFDPSLARRTSGKGKGKKRRRYDSGLGFVEEDGDEVAMVF